MKPWIARLLSDPEYLESTTKRLYAKVDRTDECWLWTGSTTPNGYGHIYVSGQHPTAHSVAWVLDTGLDLPVGIVVDHLCRTRSCVNPEHLEAVTYRENTLRGNATGNGEHNRRKTECPRGHPYAGENLITTKRGRDCRTCASMSKRLRRQKISEAKASECTTLQ